MKTLYLECGMGAAGDMLTAALLELTGNKEAFVEKLNALGLPGVHVAAEPSVKCGITGTHMHVTVDGEEEESLDEHEHHDHEHEHHHEGEEDCCCHGHHHHHDADEIFESMGIETARKFDPKALEEVLASLENEAKFGLVLRAKGIVPAEDGWMQFDYVPGEPEVRTGAAAGLTGRICVIGSKLNQDAIKAAFLK